MSPSGLVLALALLAACGGVHVSNLDSTCLHCLCEAATACDLQVTCLRGHCGPFHIAEDYWGSAGKPVLEGDSPRRAGAFQDCANDMECAQTIVENYMATYGRDCNGDDVTDCDDYALLHINGPQQCDVTINGSHYHERYTRCRPAIDTDNLGR